MIARYTRPEMGRIWSEENRFRTWLMVEVAATESLAEAGLVPKDERGYDVVQRRLVKLRRTKVIPYGWITDGVRVVRRHGRWVGIGDFATHAAEFYRRLWGEGLPPVEALRQAQLFVYRNPDRVRALAAERAAPDFSKSQPVNTGTNPPVAHAPGSPAGMAPPKWWAAFQLSGAGR